jgi:hypothetical protein
MVVLRAPTRLVGPLGTWIMAGQVQLVRSLGFVLGFDKGWRQLFYACESCTSRHWILFVSPNGGL